MDILQLINDTIRGVDTISELNYILLYAIVIVFLLTMLIRALVFFRYTTEYGLIRISLKPLAVKTDIRKTRSKLLNLAMQEYIQNCEKNISPVDTNAIISKYIDRMSLIGLPNRSALQFVEGMEKMLLPAALLGVIGFSMNSYVLVPLVLYVAMQVFRGLFDIGLIMDKIRWEIVTYLEREVGQFFLSDIRSSVLSFKREMENVMINQQTALKTSVEKMGTDLVAASMLSGKEMQGVFEKALDKIGDITKALEAPMENWASMIEKSSALQENVNGALMASKSTVTAFEGIAAELAQRLAEYQNGIGHLEGLKQKEMQRLYHAMETAEAIANNNAIINEALKEEMNFVKVNQNALDTSLQQFQAILENMAKELAEHLGNIMTYQSQLAADNMKQAMENAIFTSPVSGGEVAERILEAIDAMKELSQRQVAMMLRMKEQIDMQLEMRHPD